jgi:hypothetical protein
MTTYPCPKGHDSTDPVWCSECSTRIAGATPAPAVVVAAGEICPTPGCGTPRDGRSRYCENCRYDFDLGKAYAGDGAMTLAPVEPPPAASPPPSPVAALDTRRWEVVISVDPADWEQDPDGPAPVGEPDRIFPLDLAEHLIGRRSNHPEIHPTIVPDERDHGVSRRHAMLIRQADGSYAVKELGSTNGTKLNGKVLAPGVLTPLAAGDSLSLPFWTRVTIRTQH